MHSGAHGGQLFQKPELPGMSVLTAHSGDRILLRSDTPMQIPLDPGAAVYWAEDCRRNDDIHPADSQALHRTGGRVLRTPTT